MLYNIPLEVAVSISRVAEGFSMYPDICIPLVEAINDYIEFERDMFSQ